MYPSSKPLLKIQKDSKTARVNKKGYSQPHSYNVISILIILSNFKDSQRISRSKKLSILCKFIYCNLFGLTPEVS